MTILDANAILRYLLKDIPEQSQRTKEVIQNGATTNPEILAEVVYVLKGVYDLERSDISLSLKTLLSEIQCKEKAVVLFALDLYSEKPSLDFIDCLLCGYKAKHNASILTFDKALLKELERLSAPFTEQN